MEASTLTATLVGLAVGLLGWVLRELYAGSRRQLEALEVRVAKLEAGDIARAAQGAERDRIAQERANDAIRAGNEALRDLLARAQTTQALVGRDREPSGEWTLPSREGP